MTPAAPQRANPTTLPTPKGSPGRRTSKPIITWLQRKLTGSVARRQGSTLAENSRHTGTVDRRSTATKSHSHSARRRRPVSLNSDVQSSVTPESTWSPSSAVEADEDASIRPLPPTSPPSPSPSRSSSSYLSDPRTFKSMAASTKPTTVLSIDLGTNGMAHIAQAPATPTRLPPHLRVSAAQGLSPSTAAYTFSALPPSPRTPQNTASNIQAPLHTSHHPRNNPRPSSPPGDNASVLTLASSAFAAPGARSGGWIGDSVSHIGGGDSTSHFVNDTGTVEGGTVEGDPDIDASMRALRPRSSRRGSLETFESEVSRWSAKVPGREKASLMTGTPYSLRMDGRRTGDDEDETSTEDADGDPLPSPLARTVESFNGVSLVVPDSEDGSRDEQATPAVVPRALPVEGAGDTSIDAGGGGKDCLVCASVDSETAQNAGALDEAGDVTRPSVDKNTEQTTS